MDAFRFWKLVERWQKVRGELSVQQLAIFLRMADYTYEEAREFIVKAVESDNTKPNLYMQLEMLAHVYLEENPRYLNKRRILVGSHSEKGWETKKEQYGHRCFYCGAKTKLTKDHVIPVVLGGNNTIDNIVPACMKCNRRKSIKPLAIYKSGSMLKLL